MCVCMWMGGWVGVCVFSVCLVYGWVSILYVCVYVYVHEGRVNEDVDRACAAVRWRAERGDVATRGDCQLPQHSTTQTFVRRQEIISTQHSYNSQTNSIQCLRHLQ
jgi:hypothetical protein